MAEKNNNFLSQLNSLGKKDLSKAPEYPSKKGINFITAEHKKKTNFSKVIPILIIIVVIIFGKFFVYDLISETVEAKRNYTTMQTSIAILKATNKDYDRIKNEYDRFGNGHLLKEDKEMPNRMEMLSVIENRITPYATIRGIEINDDVAIVTVSGASLEEISSIVASLKSQEDVTFVSVTTAGTEEEGGVISTITMTFEREGK